MHQFILIVSVELLQSDESIFLFMKRKQAFFAVVGLGDVAAVKTVCLIGVKTGVPVGS